MKKQRRRRLKHAGGESSSSSDGELELDLPDPPPVAPAAAKGTGPKGRRLRQRAGGSDSSDGAEDNEIEALVASAASSSQPTASQAMTTQSAASQPVAPAVPAPAPAAPLPAAASADVASILDSSDDSSSAARGKRRRKRIRRGGEASQGSAPPSPVAWPAAADVAAASSLVQTPPSVAGCRGGGRRLWSTPRSSGRSTEQAVLQRTRERVRGGRLRELEEEDEEDADAEDEMGSFIAPEDDEEAEDEGEVRCVCGVEARDADVLWVQCANEECERWVHGPCFGIRREKDVPRHFSCHVCDPDGKTRRGIILPASAAGPPPAQGGKKRRRARKAKDAASPVELYARLERPFGPWGQYGGGGGGGDPDENEEDAALGQLVVRAVEQFGWPELARPRGPYKRSGFTLLMAAAAAGRVAAVRALLEGEAAASGSAAWGVEPVVLARDAERRTAAHHVLAAVEASEAAVIETLERLLEGCRGDADRRRLLLSRDRSRRNLLHAAAARGGDYSAAAGGEAAVRGGVMRFLIAQLGAADAAALAAQDDATGRPPLAVACAEGGEAECEALLGVTTPQVVAVAEADSEKGVTALMEAIDRGLGHVARRMIAMGGQGLLCEKDRRGESVLHRACMVGDAETVAAILEECPELVHEPNKEQTYPLHFAALGGAEACVVKLLEHGARPDVKDEGGWSPLLYADFQGEQGCVLQLLAVQPESQLAILGDLLAGPMRGDAKVVKLLRSLTAVPSFSRFINKYVRENMELLSSSLAFLLEGEDGRQLLDLSTKALWLERQLQAVRQQALEEAFGGELAASHPYYTDSEDEDYYEVLAASRAQHRPHLALSRDECWPALLRAAAGNRLAPSPAALFRRNVLLQLRNSPGIGPGVEREVLELLAQGVVGAQGHEAGAILTLAPDNGSYLPRLPINKEAESGFYLLGILAGHVILYMPKHISVNINSVFLKLVLRHDIVLSDLQDLDHDYHRSLEELLQNDGADDLCLSFTQPGPTGGKEVELCPGGKDRDVTDLNKAEYVCLVVRHRTHGTYGRAAEAMRRGICDVLLDPLGRLLKLYTAPELGTLIAGIHDVDPADWEAHATYAGDYKPNSSPVQWFWSVVRQLSKEERALLLKFSTGSSRLPVEGFAGLKPCFLIQKLAYDPRRPLPTSSTCFNMLKLPEYPDKASLEKNLLLAIRFGAEGFAFT